jgi:hypothetical protein
MPDRVHQTIKRDFFAHDPLALPERGSSNTVHSSQPIALSAAFAGAP